MYSNEEREHINQLKSLFKQKIEIYKQEGSKRKSILLEKINTNNPSEATFIKELLYENVIQTTKDPTIWIPTRAYYKSV